MLTPPRLGRQTSGRRQHGRAMAGPLGVAALLLIGAPHRQAARAWLDFVVTDAAFATMAPYGFQRVGQ
jgi:hypothetical protein